MDTLTELLTAMSGVSDVAAVVLAIVVVVWVVNKFLEKQQEQQLLFVEQNNKTIKTISNYTEAITKLIVLMENNLDKTEKIENSQSSIIKKIEELDDKFNKKDNE